MIVSKIKHKLSKGNRKKLHDHIDHHVCKYYHKHFHVAHHSHHHFAHIGELALVLLVGCMSWIFAGSVGLPTNNSFVYPLQQVSTLECRTQYRDSMDASCQIALPRITNADYEAYKQSQRHRQIYTVLFAAPYKAGRDQNAGAHPGLDVATARGTPLYSIGDGEITYAGRQNGYGNVVKIKYLFKGHYIHAVYGHMDIIQVQAGQRVSAGQQIGTVGNSGTTFGALGGFHLHLEITRDNRGRPMYAYSECPDLSKGHMTIIQNGLCREQLLTNLYDPIVLFEQNRLGHVIIDKKDVEEVIENTIPETQTGIQEEIINQPESPTLTTPSQTTIEKPETKETVPSSNIENPVEHSAPIIETQVPSDPIDTEIFRDESTTLPKIETPLDGIKGEKVTIDIEGLSEEIQHFFKTHELYIDNHTGNNQLKVGSTKDLEINFYRKGSDSKFIGVLPFTLEVIPSQTIITTNINNLQLISPNPTIIQIKGAQSGNSTLLFSINGKTIYRIPFIIN